jgi:hypothetical protein
MNNFEISKYARSNKTTEKVFRGVYASDRIPKFRNTLKLDVAIIINSCESRVNDVSCHWTLLYKRKGSGKQIFYYDPLGTDSHITNQYLKKYLKAFTVKVSKQNHQGNRSELCGVFCLIKMWQLASGLKTRRFNAWLSASDPNDNDQVAMAIFKNIFVKRAL